MDWMIAYRNQLMQEHGVQHADVQNFCAGVDDASFAALWPSQPACHGTVQFPNIAPPLAMQLPFHGRTDFVDQFACSKTMSYDTQAGAYGRIHPDCSPASHEFNLAESPEASDPSSFMPSFPIARLPAQDVGSDGVLLDVSESPISSGELDIAADTIPTSQMFHQRQFRQLVHPVGLQLPLCSLPPTDATLLSLSRTQPNNWHHMPLQHGNGYEAQSNTFAQAVAAAAAKPPALPSCPPSGGMQGQNGPVTTFHAWQTQPQVADNFPSIAPAMASTAPTAYVSAGCPAQHPEHGHSSGQSHTDAATEDSFSKSESGREVHRTTPSKRKAESAERDETAEGSDERLDGGTQRGESMKKQRLIWTPELHQRFVQAVLQLGVNNAVPKTILQLMNVDGMTRENVASHLQKYRLQLKRAAGVPANQRIPQEMHERVQQHAMHQHALAQQQVGRQPPLLLPPMQAPSQQAQPAQFQSTSAAAPQQMQPNQQPPQQQQLHPQQQQQEEQGGLLGQLSGNLQCLQTDGSASLVRPAHPGLLGLDDLAVLSSLQLPANASQQLQLLQQAGLGALPPAVELPHHQLGGMGLLGASGALLGPGLPLSLLQGSAGLPQAGMGALRRMGGDSGLSGLSSSGLHAMPHRSAAQLGLSHSTPMALAPSSSGHTSAGFGGVTSHLSSHLASQLMYMQQQQQQPSQLAQLMSHMGHVGHVAQLGGMASASLGAQHHGGGGPWGGPSHGMYAALTSGGTQLGCM